MNLYTLNVFDKRGNLSVVCSVYSSTAGEIAFRESEHSKNGSFRIYDGNGFVINKGGKK